MTRWIVVTLILATCCFSSDVGYAIGRGGGGFRGGGSMRGGGGGMRGGGGARPSISSRPNVSRPNVSRPNVSWPNVSRPNVSRPNVSRPNVSRPSVSRPQARPNMSQPTSRPSINRPSGGLSPSSRPGVTTRPNFPSSPGAGGSGVASRPGSRPSTSLPTLGGSRPGTNRPNITRPGGELTNRPGGITRPAPGNRPNIGNRPGSGGGRPSAGDLGDFLGMDKPLRPGGGGTASTLPGRPGIDNRPGIGNRPGERPGLANRPGSGNRPDFGDRWNNNNVISSRPGWANIDNSTNVNIHNRWNSAFANTRNPGWWNRPANRIGYWHGWADGVRGSWGYYHRHNGWFNSGWWNRHYFPAGGWGYWYGIERYPSNYWWRVPAWTTLSSWFVWTAPTTAWSQPVYYDYGSGGNVTYENNNVYVGGEQVATEDEFAMSAMDLATVTPPASEEEAQSAEWMPLGTFAVSTDQKDVNPDLVIQLAVNKQGVISGSLYNVTSDQAQAVQGQVDKETQRVAFRIGESDSIVAETGLYNLTQNEAPVLVHFATERDENYLLVRLEQPEDGEQTVQEGTP